MASLFFRGNVWYGRHIYYVNGNRKEKKKSFDTADEKVARRRLGRWENELAAQKWGEAVPLLFEEVARRFMLQHAAHLKPNTQIRYGTSSRQVVPFFTGKRIDSISKSDLLGFESKRRKDPGQNNRGKVKDVSIRRDFGYLSTVFSFAISNEWIEHNPVPAFLKSRNKVLKQGQARTRYLSKAEEERLLFAILNGPQHNRNLTQFHYDMVEFAIETGLRQDEQRQLKWHQVQFDGKPGVVISESKSGKSRRVPLSPRAQMVLSRRPQHPTSQYVFWWGKKGKPVGDMDRAFKAAAARAKITDVMWHDLRRTCGCRLLQERKASMTQVRDWLGHSSVAVTEKHYAFLTYEDLAELVDQPVQPFEAPARGAPLGQTTGQVLQLTAKKIA